MTWYALSVLTRLHWSALVAAILCALVGTIAAVNALEARGSSSERYRLQATPLPKWALSLFAASVLFWLVFVTTPAEPCEVLPTEHSQCVTAK